VSKCHIVVGSLPLCDCAMETRFGIIAQARALGIPPCCGHWSYRNAVMIATLLEETGIENVRVVPGSCPTELYNPYDDQDRS
jgi:hypothetical protein